ncbi:hypothetical protein ACF0H5_018036 [Mactra antiquata]
MERFGLFRLLVILLISAIGFVQIRADSDSFYILLVKGISDRLDEMERTFGTKLDNEMNEVKERLVRLENKVGIDGPNIDKQWHSDDIKSKTAEIHLDLKETKRNLLKAMSIEKQLLRGSINKYEDKLNEFKAEVTGVLKEMNTSMETSNEHLTKKIEDNTEIQRINTKTTEELNSVRDTINQVIQDQLTIGDTVAVMNLKQDDKIRNLDNRIKETRNFTEISLNSVISRINKLQETKPGFSVYLSSTKQYQADEIIVFDEIIYNTGSYHTSTGIFTVPKSGTYLFSLTVEGTHSKPAYASVLGYQDGEYWYGKQIYAAKGEDVTASATFVYHLEEGKIVWSKSRGDCEFYKLRTTFSGVLLG